MAKAAMLKVSKVQGNGAQWCAKLDAPYSRIWAYGPDPETALDRLGKHTCMLEVYRPRVQEVHRRLTAWEMEYWQVEAGVNLATVVPA